MTSQQNIKNGKQIICAEVAGGIYTSEQLQLISQLATNDIAVRATKDQRLALIVDAEEICSHYKVGRSRYFI